MLKQLLLSGPVTSSPFISIPLEVRMQEMAESNSYIHAQGFMLGGNSGVLYLVYCCLGAKNRAKICVPEPSALFVTTGLWVT